MPEPITIIVAGAGSRGATYAEYARAFPEKCRVVGVAEPREVLRERFAADHNVPRENVFSDWRDMAARDRFADAAIVATQDAMHEEPAIAFANLKYDVLLEKPMATTEQSCRNIVRAVRDNGIIFSVCHVLRYVAATRKIKEIIADGAIGDVVTIQRMEPVGYWHYAHSYVRGNWRSEAIGSPMLLAKACHDTDWIRYIMDAPCTRVSSFGALRHFRRENHPAGASDRCLDCGVEQTCPYSAVRFYMAAFDRGDTDWPLSIITPIITRENVLEALRNGPYGRCVYTSDNDVVDNQVVIMEFEGGRHASFEMGAFSKVGPRRTIIGGTRGEIISETAAGMTLYDYLNDQTREIMVSDDVPIEMSGHGGGDYGVIDTFIQGVATRDQSRILTGPMETLETHLMVFAAERSRHKGTVEPVLLDLQPPV